MTRSGRSSNFEAYDEAEVAEAEEAEAEKAEEADAEVAEADAEEAEEAEAEEAEAEEAEAEEAEAEETEAEEDAAEDDTAGTSSMSSLTTWVMSYGLAGKANAEEAGKAEVAEDTAANPPSSHSMAMLPTAFACRRGRGGREATPELAQRADLHGQRQPLHLRLHGARAAGH